MRSPVRSLVIVLVTTAAIVAATLTVPVARRSAAADGTGWDPTILPIAQQVERLRDLQFRTPVKVRFLSDADFVAGMEQSTDRWVRRAQAQLADELAVLRALGLAGADVDVSRAFTDTSANDVLAYYDPHADAITVRGGLDARTAPVVAHELTHALQDQHFDLARVDRAARRTSQQLMVDTWVEGDADRVQRLFAATQSAADRQTAEELDEEMGESLEATNSETELPSVYTALALAPYELGGPAVDQLVDRAGVPGLDHSLARVPASDREAFDPFAIGKPSPRRSIPVPRLRRGERRSGPVDDLGAVGLYLLLASRLGPAVALDAAAGWTGDRMLPFTLDGRQCVRLAVTTEDRTAGATLEAAFGAIADALPASSWSVDRTGRDVEVSACDPGAAARDPGPFAEAALTLLALRNDGIVATLHSGEPPAVARCVGSSLVRNPTVTEVATTSELDESSIDAFWTAWHDVVARCRAAAG